MKLSLIIVLACVGLSSHAQVRIDSTFSFQTDPAKKYSLYIPSNYDPASPHRLMLALHPFNTSRWWAESWCDTLIVFAEMNGLILACPDGGTDGKVDDDIDTAFTSALLDSMKLWYNIDEAKTYCMGFSWGAQTTYTYGLRHVERFGGFLPTGSSMGGTSMVSSVLANADSLPVYIVHGNNDSPSSRFTPIRDALIANGAFVNTLLMSGVGHTIDYPNRNQILSVAFQWIDSVNCSFLGQNPVAPVAAYSWFDNGGGATDFTDLSTNSPTSWLWDFGDGNASTSQNPSNNYPNLDSTYTVCLTATNIAGNNMNCQSVIIVDTSSTSIVLKSILKRIIIYPNPSTGTLVIHIESRDEREYEVRITSLKGQVVYSSTESVSSGNNDIVLEIGELSKGLYQLSMKSKDLSLTRTIVVQ